MKIHFYNYQKDHPCAEPQQICAPFLTEKAKTACPVNHDPGWTCPECYFESASYDAVEDYCQVAVTIAFEYLS